MILLALSIAATAVRAYRHALGATVHDAQASPSGIKLQ
jgi:hypothetical protein